MQGKAQDLLCMAQALGIASQGLVKFMTVEHAKDVWQEYLRTLGFEGSKKELPKLGGKSTFSYSAGTTQTGAISEPVAK